MGQSQLPSLALYIVHRVADYHAWKQAFDRHQGEREKAGILGHHVNRGEDDPNLVSVYCPCEDLGRAQAFLKSEQLATAMADAGVEGQPKVAFLTPKSADYIADQKLASMAVSHAVEDYTTWRAAYDRFDEFRTSMGIVGHAVHQVMDEPNQVVVYHQAADMAALKAFVDTPELHQAMQDAGVTSPPEFAFMQIDDFAEY